MPKSEGKPKGKKWKRPTKQPGLSAKQSLFVKEYLVDLNCKGAALRAGYTESYAHQAHRGLLQSAIVKAEIAKALEKRERSLDATADDVIRMLSHIAKADRNELTELRRGCCRYCYGRGCRYQRTPREMLEAAEFHRQSERAREAKATDRMPYVPIPFDEAGGIGFNPHRDPNPDCPECFGDGKVEVHFKDTRKLSDAAKTVFEGVKQTRNGIEIMTASRDSALEKLGRYYALFKDMSINFDLSALSDEELDKLEIIRAKIAVPGRDSG